MNDVAQVGARAGGVGDDVPGVPAGTAVPAAAAAVPEKTFLTAADVKDWPRTTHGKLKCPDCGQTGYNTLTRGSWVHKHATHVNCDVCGKPCTLTGLPVHRRSHERDDDPHRVDREVLRAWWHETIDIMFEGGMTPIRLLVDNKARNRYSVAYMTPSPEWKPQERAVARGNGGGSVSRRAGDSHLEDDPSQPDPTDVARLLGRGGENLHD